MVQTRRAGRKRLSLIAGLLCLLVIINCALGRVQNDISMYLGGSSVDESTLEYDSAACFEEGTAVAVQLQEEGSVLLKNAEAILPLKSGTKVSVLGAMSYNYVEGGTGSAGGADDVNTVMLDDALTAAGLDVNRELWDWLKEACGGRRAADAKYDGITAANWTGYQTINEFSADTYANALSHIGDYNGYVIITFARSGAEGASPTMDYDGDGSTLTGQSVLELSQNERDLLTFCNEHFTHTIVLINSSAAMELGFLDAAEYGVDAALWIGHPGEAGLSGAANLLAGLANPSGRLVDTYAYDLSTAPSFYNTDNNRYTNMLDTEMYGYYQYEEGIYVGYRYYETADAEGYFDSDAFKNAVYKNDDRPDYDGGARDEAGGYENVVQFPFGYGLSYGSFTQRIAASKIPLEVHGVNTIDVEVSNTGGYAGKQVVELFLEAPYDTDENCGIRGRGMEKAAKVLVGFAKTGVLEPGESETVTISFATDDLASYDYCGYGCYVLEKGTYRFHVSENAHTVIETAEAVLADSIVYDDAHAGKRSSDLVTAVNQMDDVSAGDGNMLDGYLSRSDFAAGMDAIKQHESNLHGDKAVEALGEQQKAAVELRGPGSSVAYTYEYYKNGVKTTGTKTLYVHAGTQSFYMDRTPDGLDLNDETYRVTFDSRDTAYTLADMYGEDGSALPYDDPKWEALLSQLSLEECINVHGNSGWGTPAAESVGKVADSVVDGPGEAGNGNISGGTWWPSAVVIASTWNTELANEEGTAYGHQSRLGGYVGAYAPAMNLHRSPFGGRNFEYYSEDGFLSGKIGAAVVRGLQSDGIMVYIKHFVMNDGDTNRNGVMTWASEQAVRELYGRPYELSVKEGGALGIMACLNRIGMSWGHYGLFNNILRDEWGFEGYLITDGVGPGFADLYNPPSLCLASRVAMLTRDDRVDETTYTVVEGTGATDTLYGQYLLRENMHRLLYQMVSTGDSSTSAAVNAVSSDNTVWKLGWYALDVLLAAGIVLLYVKGVHQQYTLPTLREYRERRESHG